MNLTFLGTSHGVPQADRYCTSYLLEVEDNLYIIDTGAPVADLLIRKGKDLNNVKAIFNTHFHHDHAAGALHFIDLCSWYFKDTAFTYFTPEEGAINALRGVIEASTTKLDDERIKMTAYSAGVIYDDGIIRVEAIPTKHTSYNPIISSYAFYIEAEDKKLLFTGDLSMRLEGDDFPAVAFDRHMDVIVTECAHFEPAALEAYMPRLDTDILAVCHINDIERKIPELERLNGKYDFELLIAEDDDEIEF
ncbi:MAG: ribonuclease Z [Clostridia bacterium]|nr:ribonuclease Z [Clostridia bacterium]